MQVIEYFRWLSSYFFMTLKSSAKSFKYSLFDCLSSKLQRLDFSVHGTVTDVRKGSQHRENISNSLSYICWAISCSCFFVTSPVHSKLNIKLENKMYLLNVVRYSTILYESLLFCKMLHYVQKHGALRRKILSYITKCSITLHDVKLHNKAVQYVARLYATRKNFTLPWTTVRYVVECQVLQNLTSCNWSQRRDVALLDATLHCIRLQYILRQYVRLSNVTALYRVTL